MGDKLTPRIQSGLATVKQWEFDKELLTLTRAQIPFHLLCPEQYHHNHNHNQNYIQQNGNENACEAMVLEDSSYAQPDDEKYLGDDLLLKRLTRYFKEIMTWVNNPPCELCGCTETKCKFVRGPITPEESQGQATRVEVYWCPNCNAETTLFPRYNQPRKLLETKKGRCGEYANLFGLFCRAAGFETRYVLDFTDHVWIEVYSHRLGRWIMCDGCEGVIDSPSMYEHGWGKDLNCIVAFTTETVVDVTRRYTRKFKSPDLQSRRRAICPNGEFQFEMTIAQFNANIRHANRLSRKRMTELDQRLAMEQSFLDAAGQMDQWQDGDYSEGRQSGSLDWKMARGEAGDVTQKQSTKSKGAATIRSSIIDLSMHDLKNLSNLTLRCENDAVPSRLSTRLPDSFMPVATQLSASILAKKQAFLDFIKNGSGLANAPGSYIGFCTKQGLPIYLITKSAYPLQKVTGSINNEMSMWKTFHFVPDSLSGEEEGKNEPTFDIPVDEDFFLTILGSHLMKYDGGQLVQLPTISCLKKSRLVALYFSAHWCGPCRRFTPMLCEMYLHLKATFAVHGLELIFVTSDHDNFSFKKYFSTMPWLAIPFEEASRRRSLSQSIGVEGIPSLVVLDTVSGGVVVPKEICRSEVSKACQAGEDAIEAMYTSWVDLIPEDSKAMIETLKISCIEEETEEEVEEELEVEVSAPIEKSFSKEEYAERVKTIFLSLVGEGYSPNEAGAKALIQANETIGLGSPSQEEVDKSKNDEKEEAEKVAEKIDAKDLEHDVISLVLKYISNVEKNPSTPKFRMMKLGNKIFDKITSSTNGLRFIEFLGFHLFHSEVDFAATIPLSADIASMKSTAEEFLANKMEGEITNE